MPAGFPFTRSLAKYIIELYVGMRIAPTTEKTPAKKKTQKAVQARFQI